MVTIFPPPPKTPTSAASPLKSKFLSAIPISNLEEDIGETTDVSARHPEIVSKLEALAEASRDDLGDGPDRLGRNVREAAYIPLGEAKTLTPRPEPWSKVQRRESQ